MGIYAADIECTGLLHQMYKQENPYLHNMCLKNMTTGGVILFSNKYDELKEKPEYIHPLSELDDFLAKGHTLYIHNGIGFDSVALKFLGYNNIDKCIIKDTLGFSWYLQPKRLKHGLASYGEDVGVFKPEVEEWENQPQEVYNHRVLEDTKIQYLVAQDQIRDFKTLYGKESFEPIMAYLNMKMKHIAIQEQNKWELDVPATELLFEELEEKLAIQTTDLIAVMPKVAVKVLKTFPAKPFKANGKLSATGKKWYSLLLREQMPIHTKELVLITGYEEPNPNSVQQVKSWLDSFGWQPVTFEYKRDKETGKERKIPQVNIKNSGGLVDPDIERLILDHPDAGFDHLRGLGILKHRVGMVRGFIENNVDGFMQAGASGFTNTLRLKHRNLVNIPSTRVAYGERIRSLLIAGEGNILLGSDLSSLEDKCKHHYQMKFDPEYVKLQQVPGFDPHLLMCEAAGLLTPAQVQAHKDGTEDHSKVRHAGKSCNYASQYGAGAATIARAAGVSHQVGEILHRAYHDLNWSIDAIAESTTVKKALGTAWQKNPVNGFWYWLKAEKDRFSTLCQGTGSYIMDMWVENCHSICRVNYNKDAPMIGQFHDELIMRLKDTILSRGIMEKVVIEAMDRVNKIVQCNVEFGCSIDFGDNYAQIH